MHLSKRGQDTREINYRRCTLPETLKADKVTEVHKTDVKLKNK